MVSVNQYLLDVATLVDQQILSLLPDSVDKLSAAMHYSALSSGKRLRPFILISTADIWQVKREYSLRVAAAIEIIHSYSLIHDDLPAMDNDDYRRGLPSCHKKFDESTAILAGDCLLTLAFEILSNPKTHPDPEVRCKLITILAENIGTQGMAGGQVWDLIYEKEESASYSDLLKMQWMKTAKLFIACTQMGAALGMASSEDSLHLYKYAENFGLAFQLIDDVEDLYEETSLSNNNIVRLIGKEKTLSAAHNFIKEARQAIAFLKEKGKILDQLVIQLL